MTKSILIFGGNGMMGFETLKLLLEDFGGSNLKLYLLNRGRSWDWDKKALLPADDGTIRMIKWNRKKPLNECTELSDILDQVKLFDVVLDFSGYVKYYIEQAVAVLQGRMGIYVYISTDSIYEVCNTPNHGGASKETDDCRPLSQAEQEQLNKGDDYGHEKLECEETLRLSFNDSSLPFVCFRLPDVMGPRDGTERWFQCQLWITALGRAVPNMVVFLQKALQEKSICMVYSKDVARLIVRIVSMEAVERKGIVGETFNLAFLEPLTVEHVLKTIQQSVETPELNLSHIDNLDVPVMYPSVMRGPVDITKAKCVLKWEPTPFVQAVQETTTFYVNAMKNVKYTEEKKSCMKDLLRDLKPLYAEKDYVQLKSAMKQILHLQ